MPTQWIGAEVFSDLRGALGLVRCRGCTLVFTNPRPAADRLNTFYSGDTYSCHEETGSASAGTKGALVLKRIIAHARADAPRTLLDCGAGGGAFLRDARDRGWTVRGFEPGRRGLESCLRAGLPVTDKLDEIADGTFGVVTLHHVFEHLVDPVGVLNGITRFLAPGGQVYIEVRP
ncbi:MAG TPA: class I SAM-dependent methyltransferase [Gemmatimonadales bacterium]|nr:class I SAM-dependent methyltransferase [Gemmatimonadales bacterium]